MPPEEYNRSHKALLCCSCVFCVFVCCCRYMTSTVFCVASQGFASKDVVRVQQLLVLSMGVSYVVGSCVSWIWVFIGRP